MKQDKYCSNFFLLLCILSVSIWCCDAWIKTSLRLLLGHWKIIKNITINSGMLFVAAWREICIAPGWCLLKIHNGDYSGYSKIDKVKINHTFFCGVIAYCTHSGRHLFRVWWGDWSFIPIACTAYCVWCHASDELWKSDISACRNVKKPGIENQPKIVAASSQLYP